MIRQSLRIASLACLVAWTSYATAAQLSATAGSATIGVGDVTTVDIYLDLQTGEEASLFEGAFDLSGLGTIATVDLSPGGPTWGSSVGNVQSGQALVSLTSANAAGTRQVASLTITGETPGTVDVSLGNPAPQAASDIATPPFLQDILITTGTGTLLASVTVTDAVDSDGDGIADSADNCTQVANADQRDSNGDGFGNRCDADLNNDCIVNTLDLGLFKNVFFTPDPDADLDGNGVVNAVDLGNFKTLFFQPPGPSGVPNDCETR